MIELRPIVLRGHGVTLEPLAAEHAAGLAEAAADGQLWTLRYTFVPEPTAVESYIDTALTAWARGVALPFVVRLASDGRIVGSTRYHDVVAEIDRVEIGSTWYAASWQRTHVNTACKLLLLGHAFDTLGCAVVGLRTDIENQRSQRAIEALGARRDGVLRHHMARRDGTVRDSVFYSIVAGEWPQVQRELQARLQRRCSDRVTVRDR